ncbi:hypothetical protein GCM10008931_31380 [Oceanobacillus oncorhynchi subsp. oncorhynchi]|uniref:hypothetical protein n=1 Tax=Oceanobacillus oncorhynchi TaxID=545501 RepID=UPI0031DFC9A4
MEIMVVNSFQNLAELEEDLKKLGRFDDYSFIIECAKEVATMPEVQEQGGVKVRMDYEEDYIAPIFEIVKNEDEEIPSCDLVYRGTHHFKY